MKTSDKLLATDQAAYATINSQRASREAKTAKLRELRLAREAELAKEKAAPAQAPVKRKRKSAEA